MALAQLSQSGPLLSRTQNPLGTVGRRGHKQCEVVIRVRVYVYANQIAARHPQIDYKSKSGYRANSKSALDRYCRLTWLTDTQLLTSREQERCDSTRQEPKAKSAASLKGQFCQSISLKLPQRQGVGGGKLTPKRVCAI